ncbi:MAG: hypothetical protein Kow0089_02420 [Desulfobulbaceae bacterium]
MTFSPFRHIGSIFRKNRPIQLTFFLTRRCNARCPFCFYLSGERGIAGKGDELSLAEIDRLSSSLGNLLWLAFSGGEIFLREDLPEIVDMFYRRNRPVHILLPTNGMLPEVIAEQCEIILARSPESAVTVKLSLDGIEEHHDTLRGVPGAFRKCMGTYERLAPMTEKYENLELGMNTVFCAANQDHMEEIISFVRGLERIGTHTVSLVRGEMGDQTLKDVDMEKYHRTIDLLAKDLRSGRSATYRFRGGRLKAAQDILQRSLIRRTRMEQRQVIPCLAGRLTAVVTESGDVYPCESFTGRLGNVREWNYDLSRILHHPGNGEVLAAIRRGECFCTHECYMMMNIFFNARAYPALLKEYLRL